MKPSLFASLTAALLWAAAAAGADSPSLASIFTNPPAPANAHPIGLGLRRPSVILIACRGLARGDLSCYGQTNWQTPNLDRMAAEGARFEDYRAGGDDLAGGQGALMTGGAAAVAGSLATRLQRAGYHTGLFGEWALGPEPWKQGFDDFNGFLKEREADNFYSDFVWSYLPFRVREGTNYVLHPRFARQPVYANEGGRKQEFIPDFLAGMMMKFVDVNVPDSANHHQPFFLLADLPLPHSVTPGRDDYPVPTDAPFSGEQWPQAAKNRAALVTRLDTIVGRLFEQLQKSRMTNNVAVLVAGVTAPEKFADTNLDFLRLPGEVRGGAAPERLRVPMIVRWPGHVPAGRVERTPWSAADFAATVLDIAGETPPGAGGASVLPTLLGTPNTKQ